MNISKYFWDLNPKALAETKKIIASPWHQRFLEKVTTMLSRCDKPKELFSLLSKEDFVKNWPRINTYWKRLEAQSDFRDWWQAIYEQLLQKKGMEIKAIKGQRPEMFLELGSVIKKQRVQKGMNQKQLALMAGMRQPDISKIEEGKKNITLSSLYRLCKVLGIKSIKIEG